MIKGIEIALDLFFTGVLLIVSWLLTRKLPLYDRTYVFSDSSYFLPKPPDEPYYIMLVFIWLLPLAWLLIVSTIVLRSSWKTFIIALAWLHSQAFVIFITALMRYWLPSPRPYYGSFCNLDRLKLENDAALIGNINDSGFCSGVTLERRDVQSFPSGHTSSVWTSWIFVALVLSHITRTFARKGAFWKLVLFFGSALVVPIWMSLERVRSGNHFLYEMIIGTFVGVAIALLSYLNADKVVMEK